MATDQKATSEVCEAYCSSNHTASACERSEDNKARTESSLSKALAHRALDGSNINGRRGRTRKVRNCEELKVLPSRLSKVSLADETETK
ncbi:hypothetical protein ACH5RR_010839 [Cinchona calisaya]|uniref:Uncharacterized protein n=1 Tax=Cinchona calisaya TaxID=153742 RepID=A0ABD3AK20_9GENT